MQSRSNRKSRLFSEQVPQLIGRIRQATHVQRLPARHTASAARKIAAKLDAQANELPADMDLDAFRVAVRQALGKQGSLDGLDRREQRYSPWVLFHPEDRDEEWIGSDARLSRAYVKWQTHSQSPFLAGRLITAFLMAYPKRASVREFWLEHLRKLVRDAPTVRLAEWSRRDQEFGVLQSDGYRQLADTLLESEQPVEDILESAGMTGALEYSRFMAIAHNKLLESVGKSFNGKVFRRIKGLLHTKNRLRFPQHKHHVANGLISPLHSWSGDKRLQSEVRDFIMLHLGHPRTNPHNWKYVSQDCVDLFSRWLVDEILTEFFAIVKAAALDHQWQHREKFWKAYINRGYIEDAWIALGPRAEAMGAAYLRERGLSFGRLEGAEPTQSVLILKVMRCTVVEWSHNGSCRVWRHTTKDAPRTGRPVYHAREFLRQDAHEQIRHDGAESGRWQKQLAGYFSIQEGINVGESEYR